MWEGERTQRRSEREREREREHKCGRVREHRVVGERERHRESN